ncbi:alpha-L-rhamnosidase, partial [hydrothermal vent metagenome]
SDQSIQIVYEGKKLNSRDKVYWKVKIWDQENETSYWSKTATWEMGLLDQSDWQAKWIGKEELQNVKVGQKNPALYFRKEFVIKNNIQNARAYISGLGYYELYINGKKVGDHVLSPNQTNYDRRQVDKFGDKRIANMSTRVLYETYDISSYLQKGKNVAAVILGNGWYFRSEREEYLPLSYDLPRFITQIEVGYADDTMQKIVSDETWKDSKGPIVENSIYYGEVYDARLEKPDWNKKGFDDSKWEYAKVVRAPEGKLCAQMSPPDRVVGIIQPVKITTPREGIYRYDFGTMFSGWVKLKVEGKRGTKLKLTFFEDNGNTYEQTDTYILKGEGVEEWEPRFTWHAFRYVEVSGSPVTLTLDNLEGQIVHTDVRSAGTFKSSNDLFNRILTDYKKTQLDNMHGGVPSDCPHRERR